MACPICKAQSETKYRPFCSARCADIDLGRWMTGQYVLPERADDAEEEAVLQRNLSKAQDF